MFKLTDLTTVLVVVTWTFWCFGASVLGEEFDFIPEELDAEAKDIWYHDLGVARVSGDGKVQELATNVTQDLGVKTKKPTQDGETSSDSNSDSDRQCDFGGKIMRVALSPQPPFVNCVQNLYGEWNCNGSNIEVVKVLAERFNFQPEWVVLTNSHWSAKTTTIASQANDSILTDEPQLKTQEYTGVLGLVAKGRALMSANGLFETGDRRRDLQLSQAFDMFRLHFLLSKSVREHDHIFIKPFSPQTWAAILISALLIVPVFYFLNSTTAYYNLQEDKALSRLPPWLCVRVVGKQLAKRQGRHRDSSSSSSSFDDEIEKLASAPVALVDLSMTRAQPPTSSPQFSKNQRRLLRQKWTMDRRKARRSARASQNSGFFKVAYLIWYVVSSLANQGGETEDLPAANSTRILVAFWWMYLIVVVAIHSGILTAILTFPKQNDYIQTLEDYLDLTAYERALMRLSVDKNSELAHFLSSEKNFHKSPLQLISSQVADESLFDDEELESPFEHVDFIGHRARVLDDIQAGHRAMIEEKSTIDHIVTQEFFDHKPPKCLFKSSRFAIDVIPMHFVLSKTLITPTCLESFNSVLEYILKTGLAIKWRRRYEAQGNDCLNTVIINAGDVDKIEYRHVRAAFWLLGVGLMIGSVALILELIWLLTIDEENDDDDSDEDEQSTTDNSSTEISSSDEDSEDEVRLGHRIMAHGETLQVRSLDIKRKLKKFKAKHSANMLDAVDLADKIPEIPTIVLPLELNTNLMGQLQADSDVVGQKRNVKKQRRLAKAAEKRARRLKRTIDLVKRLQDGKIYSQKLKQRARRASHAIISRLAPSQLHEGHRRGSRRSSHLRPSNSVGPSGNWLDISPAW